MNGETHFLSPTPDLATASFTLHQRFYRENMLPLSRQAKFIVLGCTISTHLHAFLTGDPYPNVSHLNHADIIGTITFRRQEKR